MSLRDLLRGRRKEARQSARLQDLAARARAPGLTLRGAARVFSANVTAWIIAALIVVVGGARLVIGDFGAWDLVIVAGFVAVHPLVEWVIHVFLLHFRPRRVLGITIDPIAARDHRAHHREPWDLRKIFIPIRTGLTGLVIGGVVAYLVMPTVGLAVTAYLTMIVLAGFYEWTHFLCHTSYKARSRWYKRIWRQHRLHHFKNEHYWFGVTMHAGDLLLGTRPDVNTVATSPTCRALFDEG